MVSLETPRYPYMMDGNGKFALIIPPMRDDEDQSGIKVKRLRLRMHNNTKKFYNITESQLDQFGCITETYFADEVFVLDDNPVTGVVLLLKSFDHKKTKLSELSVTLFETIKNQQKEIRTLKRINARINYERNMMLAHPEEYWKNTASILKEMFSIRGRFDSFAPPESGDKEKGEQDGE